MTRHKADAWLEQWGRTYNTPHAILSGHIADELRLDIESSEETFAKATRRLKLALDVLGVPPTPTTPPAGEPDHGQPSGEAVQTGGERASESSTRTE